MKCAGTATGTWQQLANVFNGASTDSSAAPLPANLGNSSPPALRLNPVAGSDQGGFPVSPAVALGQSPVKVDRPSVAFGWASQENQADAAFSAIGMQSLESLMVLAHSVTGAGQNDLEAGDFLGSADPLTSGWGI